MPLILIPPPLAFKCSTFQIPVYVAAAKAMNAERHKPLSLIPYPQRITTIIQTTAIRQRKPQRQIGEPEPGQRDINTAHIPIKRRSPRVVEIGRKPRRSILGDRTCQMPIAVRSRAIVMKKIAVGKSPGHPFQSHDRSLFTPAPGRSLWPGGCAQTRSPARPARW